MASTELPMNGQQSHIRVLVGNNAPFGRDKVVSWKIKEKVTKFQDDHAGEKFSKTDKQRDGWAISLELHHASDALIRALDAQQVLRENNLPFEPISIQLQLDQRDSSIKGYLFTEVTTEEDLSMSSRKDRLKYSLECDAEQRSFLTT